MTIVEDDQGVFQRLTASSIASLGLTGNSGLTLQFHEYRPFFYTYASINDRGVKQRLNAVCVR
jgi:hypothetical protein